MVLIGISLTTNNAEHLSWTYVPSHFLKHFIWNNFNLKSY